MIVFVKFQKNPFSHPALVPQVETLRITVPSISQLQHHCPRRSLLFFPSVDSSIINSFSTNFVIDVVLGVHGGVVASSVASQQEGNGLIPELTEGVLLCVSLNIDYVYFITVYCTFYNFFKYDLDYCMRHFEVNKIFAKWLLVVTPLVLFILMLFKRYIINLGWRGHTAGSIATSHFQVSGLILSLCYSLCGILHVFFCVCVFSAGSLVFSHHLNTHQLVNWLC